MEYGYHRKTDFGVYEEMFMEMVGESGGKWGKGAADGCKGAADGCKGAADGCKGAADGCKGAAEHWAQPLHQIYHFSVISQ